MRHLKTASILTEISENAKERFGIIIFPSRSSFLKIGRYFIKTRICFSGL